MPKGGKPFKKIYQTADFQKNLPIFETETMNTFTQNTWWWKNLRKQS